MNVRRLFGIFKLSLGHTLSVLSRWAEWKNNGIHGRRDHPQDAAFKRTSSTPPIAGSRTGLVAGMRRASRLRRLEHGHCADKCAARCYALRLSARDALCFRALAWSARKRDSRLRTAYGSFAVHLRKPSLAFMPGLPALTLSRRNGCGPAVRSRSP